MQPTTYFVGLDIGTTATKACAFNEAGRLLALVERAYRLHSPVVGAAEQAAADLLAAATHCLRQLVADMGCAPEAIALSSAMHSLLLLDANYAVCSPVYTWADTRATEVLADFSPSQKLDLLRRNGTPVHPMSPMLKLRWLSQQPNSPLHKAVYAADIKSYLVHRWTESGLCLDTNLASATGMMHLSQLEWDAEAVDIAGIRLEQLPRIVAPTTALRWRREVALQVGCLGVPLFIGGSDGCLANLGSQLGEGDIALSIGTSAALRTTHHQAHIDPSVGLFNYHLLADQYVMGGASNNGANLVNWLFELLRHPYATIGELIQAAAQADSSGLVFVPHLYGERAPIYDPTATASFQGIRSHHEAAHFARAVIEGMLANILEIQAGITAVNGASRRIIASGGFTQSAYWLAFLAARAGCEVVATETPQASAYGAAILAKAALEM